MTRHRQRLGSKASYVELMQEHGDLHISYDNLDSMRCDLGKEHETNFVVTMVSKISMSDL